MPNPPGGFSRTNSTLVTGNFDSNIKQKSQIDFINTCYLPTARQVVHKQLATKVLIVACTRDHVHTYTPLYARASFDDLSNPP